MLLHVRTPLRLIAFGIWAIGCTSSNSTNTLTSDILADIDIASSESGTATVRTTLWLGYALSFHYVDLNSSDQLIATSDTLNKRLVRTTSVIGEVYYSAEFAVNRTETLFRVDLERMNGIAAPNSAVVLPKGFTIAPLPERLARSGVIVLAWQSEPSTDDMHWSIAGDCVTDAQGSVTGDRNSTTLAAGQIRVRDGHDQSESCEAQLTFSRARKGIIDPRYASGSEIRASRLRSTTLTLTP